MLQPGSEIAATATKMNPQTAIAMQMLTPQGRLIAMLPPKRRFKLPIEREQAKDEIGTDEVSKLSCHRLNRSGHPHQEWVTARTPLCSRARKLPRAALSHEIIDSFTRASVSSAAAIPFLLRFQMGTLLKRITATALILIALTIAANADILPSMVGSPTPFGSSFIFNYAAHLSTNERMDPAATSGENPAGTFFTIYDFQGFQAVTSVPADWTFSIQMTGITPSAINGATFDNPSIPNITFTYSGPVVHGPADFTGFAIESSFGATTSGKYASQATADAGPNMGQTDQAVGPLQVAAVPEASSMALCAIGLAGLCILNLARKNSRKSQKICGHPEIVLRTKSAT
jgi:hypothetical protein